jgi:hypothetical protein
MSFSTRSSSTFHLSYGVNVGYELIVFENWPRELDLQFAARLSNTNAIILAEIDLGAEFLVGASDPRCPPSSSASLGFDRPTTDEKGQRQHPLPRSTRRELVRTHVRKALLLEYLFIASHRDSGGDNGAGRLSTG